MKFYFIALARTNYRNMHILYICQTREYILSCPGCQCQYGQMERKVSIIQDNMEQATTTATATKKIECKISENLFRLLCR